MKATAKLSVFVLVDVLWQGTNRHTGPLNGPYGEMHRTYEIEENNELFSCANLDEVERRRVCIESRIFHLLF